MHVSILQQRKRKSVNSFTPPSALKLSTLESPSSHTERGVMAFLTPLPLTPVRHTVPATGNRPQYRPRTTQPSATLAAPITPPSEPTPAQPSAPWMPLPGVVHEILTPEQYDRLSAVAKENEKLLVIDFMASWCRKCLYLLPRLRKMATGMPDVYYCTVNVNKVHRLPKQFDIAKMPTFVFVRDQQRVGTIVGGAAPGKVAQDVEKAINKFVQADTE